MTSIGRRITTSHPTKARLLRKGVAQLSTHSDMRIKACAGFEHVVKSLSCLFVAAAQLSRRQSWSQLRAVVGVRGGVKARTLPAPTARRRTARTRQQPARVCPSLRHPGKCAFYDIGRYTNISGYKDFWILRIQAFLDTRIQGFLDSPRIIEQANAASCTSQSRLSCSPKL